MNMIAKERLLLTADKSRLVADGDPEGATLYCTPGTEIPDSAAKLFGLVDGRLGEGTGPVVVTDQGALTAEQVELMKAALGGSAPSGGDPGNDPATGAKEALPGGDKEKAPGQDKEKKPDGDKGAGSGTKGAAPDDLTLVKGVGPKVAEGFAKAGITTFVQIAAINPATPPAVEGTRATTNWAGIVESAKEIVAAAVAAEDTGSGAASGDGGGAAGDAGQKAD